jgi:hypothetical protein
MMVMEKLFFLLVVMSYTHKQAHIVHINTHTHKKKQKHMDIKTKMMNITHILEKTTFT